MAKNKHKRWEPTKRQIDDIVLPAYNDLSKKCVIYIKQLDCTSQYISGILKDLADAIMISYPKFKGNSTDL